MAEDQVNWYDQGGWLPPGVSVAVNNTGTPERLIYPRRRRLRLLLRWLPWV
jgi:hypothetical protein